MSDIEKWEEEDRAELLAAAKTKNPAKVKDATERIRQRRKLRELPADMRPVGFAATRGIYNALYRGSGAKKLPPWLRD